MNNKNKHKQPTDKVSNKRKKPNKNSMKPQNKPQRIAKKMDREATEERQIIPPINRFRGARARNHACSAALIQRFATVGRPGIVSSTIFAQ